MPFQVVAIGQTTGTRFPVREPHLTFLGAWDHRRRCAETFTDETYAVDHVDKYGETTTRNCTPESLGYTAEEAA